MKGLAAFAASEPGKAFARVESYWGRDPAAALEPVDDVLAHNLRAAFLITLAEDEPETSKRQALVERARKKGAAVKAMVERG